MPAFKPNRVAAPETLKMLSRANLLKLLKPFEKDEYLRGIVLPPEDPAQDTPTEYKFISLAERLLDTAKPPPAELARALFFIHVCATDEGEEEIEKALRAMAEQLAIDEGKEPASTRNSLLPDRSSSHADLALHAWLIDPSILENIYPVLKMADPKSAMTYPATKPVLEKLRLDRLEALQSALEKWFREDKRRCAGTKIRYRYEKGDKTHHFVIERPDSFVRIGLMQRSAPDEFGFPERFDLVIIRTDPAEAIIVANPKGIREKYREAFADFLLGDPELFRGPDKYDLSPLADPSSCDFTPPAGSTITAIRLVQLHYTFGEGDTLTRRHPDIIEATKREKSPIRLPRFAPSRAKFSVEFEGEVDDKGVPRPVFVEIAVPHTCRFSRHCDSEAMESWFLREGFIIEPKGEDVEHGVAKT